METPKETPVDPLSYPAQKDYGKAVQLGLPNGRPLLMGNILDLPVEERAQYMWQIQPELHTHSMYVIEPTDHKNRFGTKEVIQTQTHQTEQTQTQQIPDLAFQVKTLTNQVNHYLK